MIVAARVNVVSAVALLGGALFIGAGAVDLAPGSFQAPGPGLYPLLLAIVLGILAVILGIRGALAWRAERAWPRPTPHARQVLATIVALVAYAALLATLGFPVTTFLLLALLFRIGGVPRWRIALGVALAATAGAVLLGRLLDLPLPTGTLWTPLSLGG